MYVVWGMKVLFKVVGHGVFSCPNCGQDRSYECREARKWFLLFWVPIVPLKVIGNVVRCSTCGNDFRESVLQQQQQHSQPSGQLSDQYQNAVRGVLVNVLRQGGATNPAARAAAVQEILRAGAPGYQEHDLDQDAQVVPVDLAPLLGALAGQLPQPGREAVVAAAVRVAAADGPVTPGELAVANAVGAWLGLDPARVVAVIGASAPAAPPLDPAHRPTAVLRVPPQAGAPWREARPR